MAVDHIQAEELVVDRKQVVAADRKREPVVADHNQVAVEADRIQAEELVADRKRVAEEVDRRLEREAGHTGAAARMREAPRNQVQDDRTWGED